MTVGICPQTGKHRHHGRGEAEAHLRHLKAIKAYDGHTYPCPYCGGWHIGRLKMKAHKNKYQKGRGR